MEIPKQVEKIIKDLKEKNYQAYAVGGCVRDVLRNVEPNDWDVTTNAKPEQIKKIFPKSFYENKFGTVTILTNSKENNLKEIEITTYRIDEKYSDKRHPDNIKFAKTIEEDLARRDFTINAIALDDKLIDPFNGQKDLEKKLIRTVGNANNRFNEDALRMLRAIRFACTLDFSIEEKTFKAIQKNSESIQAISKERIRDELIKILKSNKASEGINLLQETGLLKYIIPELDQGVGVSQNKHHIFDIYEHSLRSLNVAVEKEFNLEVRFASLFHDIGKPETKQGEGPDSTFYNHDYVGAKFTFKILSRLKFPKKFVDKVALLVKNHMFVSDPERLTEAGARRILKRVGQENISDLINLRISDRLGMGRPKARPYRLRKVEYLIEKVSKDPISVKMLKIKGNDIMQLLNIEPGPKIGAINDVLLSEVIEDPKKNTKQYLEKRTKELNKENLEKLRKLAKGKIQEKKEEEDLKIKEKYWVK
ncbi:CCA tRNA nucleotidyltransferase [Patescibacteria group bacterium]|nr:CCA tRNA nucleotidyltransferase [Patescibacteria group bacterium]